jgi:hypothetical protein
MSQTSKRLLLGIGLAGLLLEGLVNHPALATDKVSLFKVITPRDEVVIGIPDTELSQLDGKNAGGVVKMLKANGTMTAWQYEVRKAEAGALEQAPLRKIGLMASDTVRVEPFTSPLKVVPIGGD